MNTEKAKLFLKGRKGLLPRIEAACSGVDNIIWFHVASYGEFEGARPVIDATRSRFPDSHILLTVFSPSVYEPRKNYPKVDWVFYLPYDTPWDVDRFLNAVRPSKAIFIIGELWPFLMRALRRRGIETYIMSFRVEKNSRYLKWYSSGLRRILRSSYKCVMAMNPQSEEKLKQMGVPEVVCTGDARVDRVLSIVSEQWSDPIVEAWTAGNKVFVAGSTDDKVEDEMILAAAEAWPEDRFLVIPHEINPAAIDAFIARAPHGAVKYTSVSSGETTAESAQILVVDTVGMLSRLYRYGFAAYVGGGFAGPIPHSVVEPASYGLPVAFGPIYHKEVHCVDFLECGAGFCVESSDAFLKLYATLRSDPEFVASAGRIASERCLESAGATSRIMDVIFGA